TIAARWHELGGNLIAAYDGSEVEIWVSSDGVNFKIVTQKASNSFALLPKDATQLRFVLSSHSSTLRRFWLIHSK
ncbi:MAG: hypothetical protein NZ937_09800, partial [Armatimonadetes bacterium]|nr:hypothetical protein [Armatimonadota bacterium]